MIDTPLSRHSPYSAYLPKGIHSIGELETKENDRRQREREPQIIIILASMQYTLCTVSAAPFNGDRAYTPLQFSLACCILPVFIFRVAMKTYVLRDRNMRRQVTVQKIRLSMIMQIKEKGLGTNPSVVI